MDEISKVLFWVFSTPPTIHQVKPTRIVSYFTLPPHLQGKIEKHALPKSVVRLTVDSRPTVHRHGDRIEMTFVSMNSQGYHKIGENFISDQQLFDTLMAIDRYCCKTLQIPSTLHKHTHTQLIYTAAINDDCGGQPGSNAIDQIQTRITVFNPSSLIPMSSIGSSKGKPSGKRRFTSCQH